MVVICIKITTVRIVYICAYSEYPQRKFIRAIYPLCALIKRLIYGVDNIIISIKCLREKVLERIRLSEEEFER